MKLWERWSIKSIKVKLTLVPLDHGGGCLRQVLLMYVSYLASRMGGLDKKVVILLEN